MKSDSHWQRVSELFDASLEKPVSEREAFLDEACVGEETVRAEVNKLLMANELAEGALGKPFRQLASDALTDAERELLIGGKAGPYELVSEAGRGGMGVVFKARDPRLNRSVAVKFLPLALQADGRAQVRFLAEARAASSLDHPNICTIYDIGETEDGRTYIAMAFYEGETLEERISKGPLPVIEAVNLAAQVALGLAHGHTAGIVHRDIKPSNVMVTLRGNAKILDFGVAKIKSDVTKTLPGTRVGTVLYMSPEQLHNEVADHRSDIWSLGAVLFEMLTGRRAFEGENEGAVLHAILHGDPLDGDLLPGESPVLRKILQKCLAKSRDDRYDSAAELASDLQAMRPPPVRSRGPVVLTSFVGREQDVQKIIGLLDESRLVTLTGTAGTGKTRLSLRVMAEMPESANDGMYFVPLAPVSDPGLVASAVANVVGVPESSVAPIAQSVKSALCGRRVLLVLDNFEQVAASAPVIADWLAGCPDLRVLVTSRLALRISGEHEYPVPPLDLPEKAAALRAADVMPSSAVALFADRARSNLPSFRVTDDNAGTVAELCHRLDGLPLAIELAAARIKLFPPKAMLKRLGDRLDLLKSSERDRPARHHTLREAIACSYDLLSVEEQELFRRFGVFVGGAALEALDAVSQAAGDVRDVLDRVESLLSHSLLRQTSRPDGEPHFFLLETIRVFAKGQLAEAGEEAEARRLHAEYYLQFAEEGEPALTGPGQGSWLDQLEADIDNLRAAFAWSEETGNIDVGLRLAAATWRFWLSRSQMEEGIQRMERLLSRPVGAEIHDVRARALRGLGTLAHLLGEGRLARRCFDESLQICKHLGDTVGQADLLNSQAWLATETGNLLVAKQLCDEALSVNRKAGTRRGIAIALNNLGWLSAHARDFAQSERYHEESLTLRREISDQRGVAYALSNLAWAKTEQGRLSEAEGHIREALEIFGTVEDELLEAWTKNQMGLVLAKKGEHQAAGEILGESLRYAKEVHNKPILVWINTFVGRAKSLAGDLAGAVEAHQAAIDIWKDFGAYAGTAMGLCSLGCIAEQRGETDKARAYYEESLRLRQQVEDLRGVQECEEALSRL